MARMTSAISPADRKLAHQMKMAGKKYDRARRDAQQPTRMQQSISRFPQGAFGRLVNASRHTLEPHQNRREIERNLRRDDTAATL